MNLILKLRVFRNIVMNDKMRRDGLMILVSCWQIATLTSVVGVSVAGYFITVLQC